MARVFCLRHRVDKSGAGQSSPASFSRLATFPAVCRKGGLNSTLVDRQNWRAASEKPADVRAGRHAARQVMSLSTKSAETPACAAMRCNWARSSYDSRREMVCSWSASYRMDSRSDRSVLRLLQQRPLWVIDAHPALWIELEAKRLRFMPKDTGEGLTVAAQCTWFFPPVLFGNSPRCFEFECRPFKSFVN